MSRPYCNRITEVKETQSNCESYSNAILGQILVLLGVTNSVEKKPLQFHFKLNKNSRNQLSSSLSFYSRLVLFCHVSC